MNGVRVEQVKKNCVWYFSKINPILKIQLHIKRQQFHYIKSRV